MRRGKESKGGETSFVSELDYMERNGDENHGLCESLGGRGPSIQSKVICTRHYHSLG